MSAKKEIHSHGGELPFSRLPGVVHEKQKKTPAAPIAPIDREGRRVVLDNTIGCHEGRDHREEEEEGGAGHGVSEPPTWEGRRYRISNSILDNIFFVDIKKIRSLLTKTSV